MPAEKFCVGVKNVLFIQYEPHLKWQRGWQRSTDGTIASAFEQGGSRCFNERRWSGDARHVDQHVKAFRHI